MGHTKATGRTFTRTLPALLLGALTLATSPVRSEPLTGPRLGGGTNMSQGMAPQTLTLARQMGLDLLRDGMDWARVEKTPGAYDFSPPRASYAATLPPGTDLTLVLNWGNRLYEGGATPHTSEALGPLADFTAVLLAQFSAIETIEVGNEMNSTNFVRGPLAEMPPLERATAYVPMLQSVAQAARAQDPDIRILGGATHSLPGAWLWQIMDAGAAAWMDAVAIHPYTTPAEQFLPQIAVLRRHPALKQMPFEVTEFGSPGGAPAADHFLRNYCQFALGGVSRAIWFPANLRGPKMSPLFSPQGQLTPAGQAFRLAQAQMESRPVTDAAPDAFTYGCQFGTDVLVLWGAPRPVTVADGVKVLRATGQPAAQPFALSETQPLVFIAPDIADQVTLAPTRLVADSFHSFAFPQGDESLAAGDSFHRYARKSGRVLPLVTLPGQDRRGVPWVPYRGRPDSAAIRLTADTLLPGRDTEIVHDYIAPLPQTLRLSASVTPGRQSVDGVLFTLSLNDETLQTHVVTPQTPLELTLDDLTLTTGDRLSLSVGSNGTPRGDTSHHRFSLWSQD